MAEVVGAQVILYVKDMVKSKCFYEETLGLPVSFDGGDYWVTFNAGGTSLAIHPGGSGSRTSDRTGISLIVTEIEAARTNMNSRGAGFGEIENPHEGVYFASTTDPDGNPVFLKPAD